MYNFYRTGRVVLVLFLVLYIIFNNIGFLSSLKVEAPKIIIKSEIKAITENTNFAAIYQRLKDDMKL